MNDALRKIIHVDMDAFYASVEQRDDPSLRGRPIAVGGSSRGGVVMAASYEARPFGVRSAMPAREAVRRCPDLVFVKPRFEAYRAASAQVYAILSSYTDLIEPHALDEAYLDVTRPLKGPPSATLLSAHIRADILRDTGLPASAGAGPNKFVAKVASALCKPDGLLVVGPHQVAPFIDALPVAHFRGVGPVTAAKLTAAGYHVGADLRHAGEQRLRTLFGRFGAFLFHLACGIDNRPVQPSRRRKSVGRQRTYLPYLNGAPACLKALADLCAEAARRLDKHRLAGRRVTIRVRDADFVTVSRQTSPARPLWRADELYETAALLLHAHAGLVDRPVRLLGVTVSALLPRNTLLGTQLLLPFTHATAA